MRRHRFQTPGWIATVLIVTTMLVAPGTSLAQDATPEANGETVKSLTREEFVTQIQEDLQYSEAATPGGTFIGALTSDIQGLHPFLAEEIATSTITGQIYEGLTGGDVRTGVPSPTGLADYWEIGPDNRTYTFHLNKDAKWHDGVDFTAEDVQFSADALANPDSGSVYTGSFVDTVESWRVIDEDTFEMVAKEPVYTFLFDVQPLAVIPKHIWEGVPFADWRTDPGATGADPSRVIGTGPFKFGEWRQGESVTLVRNDDYYGKVPYVDAYTLLVWPDHTAVINALLNDEIDATGLEVADIPVIEETPGFELAHYPTRGFFYYEFNLNDEVTTLWQDPKVRQALLYAIDRESIVNDILGGYAEVAQGTQPVISYAYAPDQITTTYTFDPEKAKALLAEAGWTDSDGDGVVEKDGAPLAFEFLYASGSPETDQIIAYIQDAWKAVGVDMTPRSMEFPALIEATTTNLDWEVAFYGFSWDASYLQDAMFGCDQYQVGFNDMKYCNPELDEIFAESKRTFDEDARRELLVEASNIVNDAQPVAVLYFDQGHAAYKDTLQNYLPGAWGTDLAYVWIQQ